jgi:hypothetical protein
MKIYTFSKDFLELEEEKIVNEPFKYPYWKCQLLNISNFEFIATTLDQFNMIMIEDDQYSRHSP